MTSPRPTDGRFNDDWTPRLKKQVSEKFRKHVLPLHVIPFLNCLETEDQEYIRAQHSQLGDTLTADVLLNLLTKKPDWFYDLIEALKHPDVGLLFLAEEFEEKILTVSAIWDIASFEDKQGRACFNGNCSTFSDDMSLTDVKTAVGMDEIDGGKSAICEAIPMAHTPQVKMTATQEESDDEYEKKKKRRKEDLSLQREQIKINLMKKITDSIKIPSDIPAAFDYLEKVEILFKEAAVGSLLLRFRIHSLSQLEKLEDLWRFGALKKVFDRDILSHERIKEMEEDAKERGHPVHNITSDLIIRQADIERCKAWLKHTNTNHNAHVEMVDGLSLASSIESGNPTTAANRQMVFRYANSRLPACLKAMIEDPFLIQRIHDFYALPELQDKMQTELNGGVTNKTKSIAELFLTWFQEEVINYGTKIGQTVLTNVVKIAALVHILIKKQNTSIIPQSIDPDEVWSEYKEVVDDQVCFKILSAMPGVSNDLLGCLEIPSSVSIDVESIGDICQSLTDMGILYHCQQGYKFVSTLLRDMFLSRFISFQDVLKPGFDFGMYPFLLHVLGFQENISYEEVSVFHENIPSVQNSAGFAVVKSITSRHISDGREAVFYKGKNEFYIPDMINLNEWTESDKPSRSKATGKIFDMQCTANLSADAYGVADDLELLHAFHWINILDSFTDTRLMVILEKRLKVSMPDIYRCVDVSSFPQLEDTKDISTTVLPETQPSGSVELDLGKRYQKKKVKLNLSGQSLSQTGIHNLTRFLAVTPTLTKLILHACKLTPAMLTEHLKSGNFEQIVHLDISNNLGIGTSLQAPLGVMCLPNLGVLEIQNCGLEDKGIGLLADDLRYVHKLRVLNVSNNSMTAKGLLELSTSLSDCTGITALRLQKSNLGVYGSIILANWVQKLVLLEVLNISDCIIDDNSIELITQSLMSKAILKLSMRNNRLRRHAAFKNTMHATLLNHFDYSENPVFDSGFYRRGHPDEAEDHESFVKFLQGPFEWRHLSFWKCNLGYRRVFQSVEEYQSMASLHYICLQENYIGDEFIRDLSKCFKKHCQLLSHVNLRQNQISDIGVNTLASALKDQNNLAEIFLDRNCFGDDGAESILKCCLTLPSFKKLDVSCNNVSKYVVIEAVKMFNATSTPQIEPNTFIVRRENYQAFVEGYTS